jgi:hypothetical protein
VGEKPAAQLRNRRSNCETCRPICKCDRSCGSRRTAEELAAADQTEPRLCDCVPAMA